MSLGLFITGTGTGVGKTYVAALIAKSLVAAGTREVNTNISGVTQGAAETGESASQVLDAAGQLSKQSEALRREVEKFLSEVRAA